MAGTGALGTTYNLPNYHGELHLLTPTDTPFYSMIAALNGTKLIRSKSWEWQTEDLATAGQNAALEGADAPTPDERIRANISNVLQVIQKAVSVSYTKQAAIDSFGGLAIGGDNPVTDEVAHQIALSLKEFTRDMEYSFLNGSYVAPANNSTARQTRGLIEAITTNVTAKSPDAALTSDEVLALMQTIWDAGGLRESETATIIVNSTLKRKLTSLFFASKFQSPERNIAGQNLQTLETDFGLVNVMLNRYMPAKTLVIASLDKCKPVMLEVPGKGVIFSEELSRTGASIKYQIYGEVGLEYGSELFHGKITGATA